MREGHGAHAHSSAKREVAQAIEQGHRHRILVVILMVYEYNTRVSELWLWEDWSRDRPFRVSGVVCSVQAENYLFQASLCCREVYSSGFFFFCRRHSVMAGGGFGEPRAAP